MVRRRRGYKVKIDMIRYRLYKANQVLDVIEAALDLRHKPSYWNIKKFITRLKKLQVS